MNKRDIDEEELTKLSNLASDFADAMKDKLWAKYKQGYRQWEDPAMVEEIRRKMAVCILKYDSGKDPSQLVDIGNLTAMLWFHEVSLS